MRVTIRAFANLEDFLSMHQHGNHAIVFLQYVQYVCMYVCTYVLTYRHTRFPNESTELSINPRVADFSDQSLTIKFYYPFFHRPFSFIIISFPFILFFPLP
jgi:hypothetical protein